MSDDSSVGSLVPQLFYDLISRVIPGSVIVPVILCSWWGPADFWKCFAKVWYSLSLENAPSFLAGLFLLALTYSTGVLLRGLGYMLSGASRKIFGHGSGIDMDKYYRIKVALPSAGGRVTKMKAEVSMAEVMVLGFGISLMLNTFGLINDAAAGRWPLASILLLCCVSLAFFRAEVRRRLVASIESHYAMIGTVPPVTS